MLQRLCIIAIILFLSTASVAQTGPCSGGSTNPLFTVVLGNPVELTLAYGGGVPYVAFVDVAAATRALYVYSFR